MYVSSHFFNIRIFMLLHYIRILISLKNITGRHRCGIFLKNQNIPFYCLCCLKLYTQPDTIKYFLFNVNVLCFAYVEMNLFSNE